MRVKISTIRPGDTIALRQPGPHYTVRSTEEVVEFPGLIRLVLVSSNGSRISLGFPEDNEIWAVGQPRTVQVPCMLCKNTYPHDVDLTTGVLVADIRGICGLCNARTTATVLKENST